jgi:hypothetical protein
MVKTLKWLALALGIIVVVGTPAVVGLRPLIGPRARPLTDRRFEATQARLDRGKYLATSAEAPCVLCHSPWDATGGGLTEVPGRELTGRNWAPDGVPFVTAPNLTPDPETGIGSRTDDELARAIREGISLDAMMPTRKYRNMNDQDLKDVFAYLKTLTPVDHFVDNTVAPTKCAKCGLTHGGGERNK